MRHLLLFSLATFLTAHLFSAELEVTNGSDGAPGSLRAQIAAADPGDTIVFSPTSPGFIDLKLGGIAISKNLTIDASGLAIAPVISGGAADVMNPTAGELRVFTIFSGNTVTMNNLTITGGTTPDGDDGTTGSSSPDNGGGIYVGGELTLINCNVTGNTTGRGGNGSVNGGGAGGRGAGIFIGSAGTLHMIDSDVSNNHTGDGGSGLTFPGRGGSGGGIYNSGTLTATNCTFSGNSTGDGGDGGAGNVDGANGGTGAGIHLDFGSTATFKNCTFHANRTGNGGSPSGTGTAGEAGSGGAMYVRNATLLLQNATVHNNMLGAGAGPATGGAGLALAGPGGSAEIKNSIIAGNVIGLGQVHPDIFQTNHPLTRSGVNLIGDNSSVTTEFPAPAVDGEPNVNGDLVGTMALPFDPDLGLFQDNGGLTRTILPNEMSPAIDPVGGDTASDTATDQRGEPRVSNLILDIGAVEIQTPVPPGPRISTRKRVTTKRNRVNLRVNVAANAAVSLRAKASGGAKARARKTGSRYKVIVKKIRKRTTRVTLTARDAFGQSDREKVKIRKR